MIVDCIYRKSISQSAFQSEAADPHVSRLRTENLRTRHIGPINLEVDGARCCCLSGASGSGKSLLLRAIADLDPHEGEVYLDGLVCSRTPPPEWRRNVGLLSADSAWWGPTVGAHFCRPDPEGLVRLGFSAEVMDWEVERLSSGERQRLALLRLLCARPRALLLDEPTANLDPAFAGIVEEMIGHYRDEFDTPVLWVSHDPGQIQRLDCEHYVVRDGRLHKDPA